MSRESAARHDLRRGETRTNSEDCDGGEPSDNFAAFKPVSRACKASTGTRSQQEDWAERWA